MSDNMFVISKRRLHKGVLYLLLLLIIIHLFHRIIDMSGSVLLAHSSFLVIVAISFFYFIKTLLMKSSKPLFFKAWLVLLLINSFGFIFTANFSFPGHLGQLYNILLVSLSFFPFYYFSKIGILESKHLKLFFIVALCCTIFEHYFTILTRMSSRNIEAGEIVSNVAYRFVFLLPYLFIFKRRKIISAGLASVLMIFIIMGSKRGALVAGVIGIVIFAYFQLRNVGQKNKVFAYSLTLMGIVIISYFGFEYFKQNELLIERMQQMAEGNSSGRDVIYSNLINFWLNSDNIFNLVFGYGFGQTIFHSGTGNWAHNDWIELLINFGVLGVITYLIIFISVAKLIISKRWNIDKRLMLLCILGIWSFTTLVSMNYTSEDSVFQSILLGYLFGSESASLD